MENKKLYLIAIIVNCIAAIASIALIVLGIIDAEVKSIVLGAALTLYSAVGIAYNSSELKFEKLKDD